MKIRTLLIALLIKAYCLSAIPAESEEGWTRFRGNNCTGVLDGYSLPDTISPQTNILWKISIPPGNSSPCIYENLIFLTCSTNETLYTICINRANGKVLWQTGINPEKIERPNRLAGLASPTPATDGKHVYVYFGSSGLVCYDFSGKEVWRKPLPIPVTQHGTGTSPVLCEDKLILLCDQDRDSYILAVNKNNGETVWQTKRPFARRGFVTPLVIHEDEPVIVAPGTLQIVAYYARNGVEKWRAYGFPNEVCPSPILAEDLIICCGWTPWSGMTRLPSYSALLNQIDKNGDGKISQDEAQSGPVRAHFLYGDTNRDNFIDKEEWETVSEILAQSENAIIAIQVGGKGDITKTHVKWKQFRGLPYVPTPLYYKGKIWLIKNGGLLTCYDFRTGKIIINEERIGSGGDYYASPVAGDDKIYLCSQAGIVTIIEATESLKVISRNQFYESIMATPAICDGTIYLRTTSSLYCFGKMR